MLSRLILICLSCALISCSGVTPPDHLAAQREKHSHPYQLVRDFSQMVGAVQAGDENAPQNLMKTYMLSETEFQHLFGADTAKRVWPEYQEKILKVLMQEADPVFKKRIDAGYTEVEVVRVSSIRPRATTAGDITMLESLKVPVEMYSVRLHHPDDTLGLRLNGFIYLDGQWRALLKAYDHLPKPEGH